MSSLIRTLAYLGLLSLIPLAADPASTPAPATAGTSQSAKPVTSTPAVPAPPKGVASTPPPATASTLPPVLVTAPTRVEQPVEQTATTTTLITQQQLEDQHYNTVADALSSVPGLSVTQAGAPGSVTSVFIHGMNSNQTLLTIDGRRQAPGLDGAADGLANLTLDNLQQIEVVRTPTSDVNGGSAMGGVINLVTLSGQGLAHPVTSFSEEAGTFDTFKENLLSRGAVGNFDYAVSLSRQDSQYPAVNSTFSGLNDPYRNLSYRGNYGYQITPEVYLDLHTAYNTTYTGSPGSFAFADPTANLQMEDWNLSPGLTAQVTDFYKTKIYYTHDQQRLDYQDPYNFAAFPSSGTDTRTQINTDSLDWQNHFQVAQDWQLTTGIQSDLAHYYIFDDYVGARTVDGNEDSLGGYLSSQWQPVAGLNVLNSIRYDTYSKFTGSFSWRQGVAYTIPVSQTVLHASGSEAYTPPSLQDLYYPGFSNPNLVPERDLGWEAGVEQPLWENRLTPSVTYYHNHITNYIQSPAPAYIPENVAVATTEGVEMALQAQPYSTLHLTLGYSIMRQVNDSAGGTDLSNRPRHTFIFNGEWTPLPGLTLAVGGNWVLNRSDADPIAADGSPVPDYFLLRASATYRINPNVSIWTRGENLTGASYQSVPGYYGTSTGLYGGVKVSF